ncbi:MBOAT family protein [Microcoleus sp. FACHB-53]|nr:MBOAT family protein [Microcoleus sp. FACHB-53]MBD2130114.1 MBOAT family protein [Microcoleus sp. FACHB-1]
MLFNSWQFIFLFLPLTVFIFFQIGRLGRPKLAMIWLIAASLFFYSWWNPAYLSLLIGSILFNYIVGYALSQPRAMPLSKKWILALAIALNLALIGYFKYANFFISSANDILDTNFNLYNLILPLGISFFTFEQMTYLIDIYRGKTQDYGFLNYCLFVTFFPRLIAGPIIRYGQVMPQFANPLIYRFSPEDLAVGMTIFWIGLSKKVLLADSISTYVTPVFNAAANGVPFTFAEGWTGALAYSFQLYFDFSGYSDMAIGVARIFGIKLPLNFDSPYKAVNIIEFWRRWHITLSNFLRDYLYIPLGGNRKGKLRRYINLMITMLLGGLWHGAGWTFVLWGGLHGAYLCVNHLWHDFRQSLGHNLKKSHWWSRGVGCLVTFLAVVVAWVFFRAENINAAITMIKTMFGANSFSLSPSPIPVVPLGRKVLLSFCLLVWLMPNTQQWLIRYNPALTEPIAKTPFSWENNGWQKLQWRPSKKLGLIFGILVFMILKSFLSAPESEFLYFNF